MLTQPLAVLPNEIKKTINGTGIPDKSLVIRDIRYWLVYVPFTSTIEWGSGKRPGSTRLIVEVTTHDGLVGYGETICLLHFVEPVLAKVVIPIAIGKSVADVERLVRHVEGAGYYHHKRAMVMATAAVEMAMWDALGKAAGKPICDLWGGRYRDTVNLTAYLFGSDPAAVRAKTAEFLQSGFRSFKVKIGMSPKTDETLLAAVRDAIGPELPLRADVNGAWTPGTARRQLARLLPFDLQYIEQPLMLDDLIGHAALRQCQSVPIAIDEGAYTLSDVGNVVRMEAADVVLLDPHELGGLWQCVKAAAVCEAAGIPVSLHSGGELGLSQLAYAHLATSIPNMSISIDTEYTYHADDVLDSMLDLSGGRIRVPESPGLGANPSPEKLAAFRTTEVRGAYLDADRPDWFAEKPAY